LEADLRVGLEHQTAHPPLAFWPKAPITAAFR
jgi:hypothetical protein